MDLADQAIFHNPSQQESQQAVRAAISTAIKDAIKEGIKDGIKKKQPGIFNEQMFNDLEDSSEDEIPEK